VQWAKPSLAGWRLALDRKLRLNVEAFGRPVVLVHVTAPGADLLPWADDGESVEPLYASIWNKTAPARFSRMMEAAQAEGDRAMRRLGHRGQLPRRVASVKAPQRRGVLHWHLALPFGTALEKVWTLKVIEFLKECKESDERLIPDPKDRFSVLFEEYCERRITRGFYGFGFMKVTYPGGNDARKAAGYLSKNAAGYMANNVVEKGSHYVSRRLTQVTGVTMRALRSCNYLYVRSRMIAAGELSDGLIPSHWSPEYVAEVARVWSLVAPNAPPLFAE
jgi:hypothetical protein